MDALQWILFMCLVGHNWSMPTQMKGDDEESEHQSVLDHIIPLNKGVEGLEYDDIAIVPKKEKHRSKREMGALNPVLWENGIVPYVLDAGIKVLPRHAKVIREAVNDYNTNTECIRLVERTTQTKYILFVWKGGCWSYIGNSPYFKGAQEISIGPGCENKGIVLHEIKHALGFYHEHQRMDRDEYIKINFKNIAAQNHAQFEKKYDDYTNYGVYDKQSVMHYSRYAFTMNGYRTIESKSDANEYLGQKFRLTSTDIDHLNAVYCTTKTKTTITTEPTSTTPTTIVTTTIPTTASKSTTMVTTTKATTMATPIGTTTPTTTLSTAPTTASKTTPKLTTMIKTTKKTTASTTKTTPTNTKTTKKPAEPPYCLYVKHYCNDSPYQDIVRLFCPATCFNSKTSI